MASVLPSFGRCMLKREWAEERAACALRTVAEDLSRRSTVRLGALREGPGQLRALQQSAHRCSFLLFWRQLKADFWHREAPWLHCGIKPSTMNIRLLAAFCLIGLMAA
jgi:hypothetical protein